MRYLIKAILMISLFPMVVEAQTRTRSNQPVPQVKRQQISQQMNRQQRAQLAEALKLAKAGQYIPAATKLFSLSSRPELAQERQQIKYILGLMLTELKLNQVAAFQFLDVLRSGSGKYNSAAVEKLMQVADSLGDDTVLNYAVARLPISEFPKAQADMLHYRVGEMRQLNGDFQGAIESYKKVNVASRYGMRSRYNMGVSLAESGQLDEAVSIFKGVISYRRTAPVTDDAKVSAIIGLARVYYQQKKWNESLALYRLIPRDHILWHEALFESSWANLRGAKFRSALSNFHSLHSPYYDEYYNPESLILRSILYLYICRFDEVDKSLGLFETRYGKLRSQITRFRAGGRDPRLYYAEIEKLKAVPVDFFAEQTVHTGRLPESVVRNVMRRADVQKSLAYLDVILEEQRRVRALSADFKTSSLGKYAENLLSSRIQNTKSAIGTMLLKHLERMESELGSFYEQASFIKYESINGRRQNLKSKLASAAEETQIDEDKDRDFYVKNGYEYWSFRGEYWLDEIGNYFYLGRSSCEQSK